MMGSGFCRSFSLFVRQRDRLLQFSPSRTQCVFAWYSTQKPELNGSFEQRQLPGRTQLSWAMDFFILARDSSLPRISRISVAPAGVTLLPETAIRTGHRT